MTNKKIPVLNIHDSFIIEKQYLAYYLYRIWSKYRKLIENINTKTEFKKILTYIEIPIKYQKINITYPMANKMITNEKQLNLIILSILKQFSKVEKTYGSNNSNKKNNILKNKPKDEMYDKLNKFIVTKNIENIIQDIIRLKLYVPN